MEILRIVCGGILLGSFGLIAIVLSSGAKRLSNFGDAILAIGVSGLFMSGGILLVSLFF